MPLRATAWATESCSKPRLERLGLQPVVRRLPIVSLARYRGRQGGLDVAGEGVGAQQQQERSRWTWVSRKRLTSFKQ